MGKSPGKWIKTVFFGKKSSKSNLSKDVTSEIKASGKATAKDYDTDSMVISSPVRPVIISSGERTELEKSSSASLMPDAAEDVRNPVELNAVSGEELIKLEQAARKVQAVFRGYLARRAFWALKGIIRLQALVRGHLVRRQAIATLSCMRAIVEFQALARGRRVRLSNGQLVIKHIPKESVVKKPADLLRTSLRVEKLSTNVFATKLVASSHTTMPLTIQYDPVDPNSVRSWLTRWSSSNFWVPLPQPKQPFDAKTKRKQTKSQTEETDTGTGRPKRSVRRIPAANNDNNNLSNSSENERSKRTMRKVNHQADSGQGQGQGQDQSLTELEKVKCNLRKMSVSTSKPPEKSELDPGKTSPGLNKVSISPTPEFPAKNNGSLNGSHVESVKQPEPEFRHEPEPELKPEPKAEPVEPPVEVQATDDKPLDQPPIEPPSLETNGKHEPEPPAANVESNGKENQKARRRKSLPAKQEYHECVSHNTPTLPSYMAATESAKAKLRAQAAARAAEEGGEDGLTRRQSLPSSTGKVMLHSPRVQKPLHANGKGGTKSNKSQVTPRDEKVVQTGWRR
ncbi:protein IQ-DOMAIN 31-like [Bidens hawaiensis]|uniref:protein IQ-DOMAIN 31-like n=1 Tax=Bidens hawaiensis TaxID=980011 RepID=UPI0040496531